jgi:hypothetical protein
MGELEKIRARSASPVTDARHRSRKLPIVSIARSSRVAVSNPQYGVGHDHGSEAVAARVDERGGEASVQTIS